MDDLVGVFLPTYRRPDLLRSAVLQWAVQTRAPDVVCVHQNGSDTSYEWCVEDLRDLVRIEWIFTPEPLKPIDWYRPPLSRLLDLGCTHFFWADHDDLYLSDHVRLRLAELRDHDFTTSDRSGVLYVTDRDYHYDPVVSFTSHPGDGMSSTMAFSRRFAETLLGDLAAHAELGYADKVIPEITMPKFRCHTSKSVSTVYVSHKGSVTSANWIDDKFK